MPQDNPSVFAISVLSLTRRSTTVKNVGSD